MDLLVNRFCRLNNIFNLRPYSIKAIVMLISPRGSKETSLITLKHSDAKP